MEYRKICAMIDVDNEKSFEGINGGPIEYLQKEAGWLEQSGVYLKDAFILDDDDDEWFRYINYLTEWAFSHNSEDFAGMSPAGFEEWRNNEAVDNTAEGKQNV